jgi:hypothetical protein
MLRCDMTSSSTHRFTAHSMQQTPTLWPRQRVTGET